jgi:hypothetical protein
VGRKRISDVRVAVRLTAEQRRKLEQLAGVLGEHTTLSQALRRLLDGLSLPEQSTARGAH